MFEENWDKPALWVEWILEVGKRLKLMGKPVNSHPVRNSYLTTSFLYSLTSSPLLSLEFKKYQVRKINAVDGKLKRLSMLTGTIIQNPIICPSYETALH